MSTEFVVADDTLVYHTLELRDLSSSGCVAAGAYTHHWLHRMYIQVDAVASLGAPQLPRVNVWTFDAVDDIFHQVRRRDQDVHENLAFGAVVP